MALRYYRNGPARSLSFPIALPTDTSMTVDSAAGFPTQFPYTLIVDPDTAFEEVVDVTAAVGNVLTITRGVDSTTASAHAAGAVVYHGISARDPREANAHVNQTTGAHGTTGSLVDTDSAQTIVGAKNFTGGLSTPAGAVVAVGGAQTITGLKTFTVTPTTSNGDVATLGGTQTFAGTKTFTNTVQSGTETHNGAETHNGTEAHTGAESHTGTAAFGNAAMRPVVASSNTDEVITSSSFVPGTEAVGVAFTAPPSGRIYVTVSAYFAQIINNETAFVSFGLRAGSSIGLGADVVLADGNRALATGDFVTTGVINRLQASRRALVTGLTGGTVYNVQVEMTTTPGGNNNVFYREIIVEPVF